MPAKFKDDMCSVGGVSITAPLKPYGQSKMFEAIKQLMHDDLVAIAKDLKFETHDLISTQTLMLTVAHELQYQWYQKATNEIPANVEKNHATQLATYDREVKDLKEGKVPTKAAKQKKAPKAKAAKAPKSTETYSILKSKVAGSPYEKKIANPKAQQHTPIVAQVMLASEKGNWTLDEVVTAVEKTGRYKANAGTIRGYVRGDLRVLAKVGIVKLEEKKAAA